MALCFLFKVYALSDFQVTSAKRFSCRGRDACYQAPPAQIPACGIPAPGSSAVLAFAVPFPGKRLLSPVRFACIVRPYMSGAKFPLRTMYRCQPLPRVIGPTVSEYYGLIRLPPDYRGSSTYGLSSLSLQTPLRFAPSSVSGFPLRASMSPYLMTSGRRTGLPSS